jgi:hypothetical protein
MDFSADDDVADADRICTSDKASGKHQVSRRDVSIPSLAHM